MNNDILANALVALMKKNKVTTAKLSLATGIAEITINKIRNGQNTNPTISTIVLIADYFKVSPNDLLLPKSHSISVLDIEERDEQLPPLLIDEFIQDIGLAVRVTNNNYPEFRKDSVLLLSDNAIPHNEDIILIKVEEQLVLCKLIIEANSYIGASLIIKDKYYQIKSENNILGVVTGVIWKRN